MAIQNTITQGASKFGIQFNGAYYRIASASVLRQAFSDPKFTVMIDLSAYATATPGGDTREVDFKRYEASLDAVEAASGATFIAKCYAWVMSQSDMAGSSAV